MPPWATSRFMRVLKLSAIARGGPLTVTHPEVKRFFMTISEAVGLVLKAAFGNFGALCILEMGEQIKIVNLARRPTAESIVQPPRSPLGR